MIEKAKACSNIPGQRRIHSLRLLELEAKAYQALSRYCVRDHENVIEYCETAIVLYKEVDEKLGISYNLNIEVCQRKIEEARKMMMSSVGADEYSCRLGATEDML